MQGMNIIPVYYRNEQSLPIRRCEIETFEDVSRVIIDEFEKRWVVDVNDDGDVSCRECEGDGCGHEQKTRERLRSVVDVDEHGVGDENEAAKTEARAATADD